MMLMITTADERSERREEVGVEEELRFRKRLQSASNETGPL